MTGAIKLGSRGAAFEAAKKMVDTGLHAMSLAQLYTFQNFGKDSTNRAIAVSRGIASGWLQHLPQGMIGLTDAAKKHFGVPSEQPVIEGQVATSRFPLTSVYERPPLSKKYIPNRLGPRDDVPAFSVRAAMSFRTLA